MPVGSSSGEKVKDLKAAVFPNREIKMLVVKDGKRDVRVVC
jgi:hemolysin-activating ACP:hemolysin acyltransferase